MKKYQIAYMITEEFNAFKAMLNDDTSPKSHLVIDEDDTLDNEIVAMTVRMKNENYIVINADIFVDFDDDEKSVALAHELAHCEGIIDEEDADRRALDKLTPEQQEILIGQWEYRHGHKYQTPMKLGDSIHADVRSRGYMCNF
jgi:hypothetical protein